MALMARVKPKLGVIRLQGYGYQNQAKGDGVILRRDGEFLIVFTKGTYFSGDKRFWLNTGRLQGCGDLSGFEIHPEDLEMVRRKLRLDTTGQIIKSQKENDMSLLTKMKPGKGTVHKNGTGPKDEKVVKKNKVEELPEEKPSAKKGQKVAVPVSGKGSGKRGRPALSEEEKAARAEAREKASSDSTKPVVKSKAAPSKQSEKDALKSTPGTRGRKPSYTLPEPGKSEILAIMPVGSFNNMVENYLPNVRSKKTTDEQKDFVARVKEAVEVPVKGVHFLLNKATAVVFLELTEKMAEDWAELGVQGAHFRRGAAKTAQAIRERFKLKGGIVAKTADEKEKSESKTAPKKSSVMKNALARAKARDEDEEDDEEEEKPKRGRPAGSTNKTAPKKKLLKRKVSTG